MYQKLAQTTALALSFTVAAAAASADETYKMGVVTFLSGPASGPFGIPAKNAAELMIDAINTGTLPIETAAPGIGGVQIEPVYVDEAGGATKQVTEFRNMVERDGVQAVVGYISSGDCLAIPPVADELKTLTVLFDCGTPRVFEEASYDYVFRTHSTATMDNVAAARYLADVLPDLKSVSGVNQNYSFGQDSWRDFSATLDVVTNDGVKTGTEQFPKLFAGQYGAEISALMVKGSDVVHSSFWGGDLEAFVLQASARGLLEDRRLLLTTGETLLESLGNQLPDGTIVGARGTFGPFAPETEFNTWFVKTFEERYGMTPTFPAYHMAAAILGLRQAAEKAGSEAASDAVSEAFRFQEFETPGGIVAMSRGNGHQAVNDIAYGMIKHVDGDITFTDVRTYSADCVNPPEGEVSIDWIRAGFPGAKCD